MVYELKLKFEIVKKQFEKGMYVMHKDYPAVVIEVDKTVIKIKQFIGKKYELISYTKTLANKVLSPYNISLISSDNSIVIPEDKLLTEFKQKILYGIINENTQLILPVKGEINMDVKYFDVKIAKIHKLTTRDIINISEGTISELVHLGLIKILNKEELHFNIVGSTIKKLKNDNTDNN